MKFVICVMTHTKIIWTIFLKLGLMDALDTENKPFLILVFHRLFKFHHFQILVIFLFISLVLFSNPDTQSLQIHFWQLLFIKQVQYIFDGTVQNITIQTDKSKVPIIEGQGKGYFCVLTPFSTIFQLYRGGQFFWLRKPEYPETTIDLSQVTDKLYHMMLYRVYLDMSRILTH